MVQLTATRHATRRVRACQVTAGRLPAPRRTVVNGPGAQRKAARCHVSNHTPRQYSLDRDTNQWRHTSERHGSALCVRRNTAERGAGDSFQQPFRAGAASKVRLPTSLDGEVAATAAARLSPPPPQRTQRRLSACSILHATRLSAWRRVGGDFSVPQTSEPGFGRDTGQWSCQTPCFN